MSREPPNSAFVGAKQAYFAGIGSGKAIFCLFSLYKLAVAPLAVGKTSLQAFSKGWQKHLVMTSPPPFSGKLPFSNEINRRFRMPKKLFQKGNKAACVNKGRPKLTGRTLALLTLDSVLAEANCREKIAKALLAYLNKNPLAFFKELVVPLIPKSAIERIEADARGENSIAQRSEFVFEAKLALTRALGRVGHSHLAESLCKSLEPLGDPEDATEVVIDVSEET
jgi:hypothetical protein